MCVLEIAYEERQRQLPAVVLPAAGKIGKAKEGIRVDILFLTHFLYGLFSKSKRYSGPAHNHQKRCVRLYEIPQLVGRTE